MAKGFQCDIQVESSNVAPGQRDTNQETNLTHNMPRLKKKFLIFIFERERERASRGGAEREGDTDSQAGSRL